MKKLRTLFILGIWVAILPYLGFPFVIKKILFLITGLFISFLAYLFYAGTRKSPAPTKTSNQTSPSIPSSYEHSQQFHSRPQPSQQPQPEIRTQPPMKAVETTPVQAQAVEKVHEHVSHSPKHHVSTPSPLSPIQVSTHEHAIKRKAIPRKKKLVKESLKIHTEFREKSRAAADISS